MFWGVEDVAPYKFAVERCAFAILMFVGAIHESPVILRGMHIFVNDPYEGYVRTGVEDVAPYNV